MDKPSLDLSILTRGQDGTSYKRGDVIFNAGDAVAEMFVVKSGSVAIEVDDDHVETVEAGDVFGEMALIDGSPRSARAVAASDCEVVAVGEKQFLFMVEETPYFALTVLRTLVRRLRSTNAR